MNSVHCELVPSCLEETDVTVIWINSKSSPFLLQNPRQLLPTMVRTRSLIIGGSKSCLTVRSFHRLLSVSIQHFKKCIQLICKFFCLLYRLETGMQSENTLKVPIDFVTLLMINTYFTI